ncbi:MAG: nucleolar zinc-finger protein [Sclerophora amabilis]|nr:MAG: nucleolar zinc-finger protein [Sclerophora amabilis]
MDKVPPDELSIVRSADQTEKSKSENLFEDVGRKVENMRREESATNNSAEPAVGEDERVVEEIESLCMNCHENGSTRLLLTRIPFFREIIVMSFSCPHCHFKDTEIQSAGQIQERGSRYTFVVSSKNDLSRQVVKSDTCVVKVRELDLEIPAGRGQLTNIEGLLSMIVEDLEFQQPARRSLEPALYNKIEEICKTGRAMMTGEQLPFTVFVDDPAGNSWIEPSPDGSNREWSRSEYQRTAEQNESLSLGDAGKDIEKSRTNNLGAQIVPQLQKDTGEGLEEVEIVPDEVYSFPTSCPGCTKPCTTNMKMVQIPHFKEVVIMSTVCEQCGYRTNEVKTGGAVPSLGRRITLKVERAEDLSRDILKSESCAFSCPELNLSINPGTLGGRFTTVEGLLTQVRGDLRSQIFDTEDDSQIGGDSLAADDRSKWAEFFSNMDRAIKGEDKFTVVLEDPLASSYVQNLQAPDSDPQISIEDYERTKEEEDDLGLNDINVEGYGEEDTSETAKGTT